MSHLILENDLTISARDGEWHGLAFVPESVETDAEKAEKERETMIPKLVRENLLFPMIQSEAIMEIDGVRVPLVDENGKGWKIIAADTRNIPPHKGRESHPAPFVPLHVPKQGYVPMENGRFFDIAEKAFSALGLEFRVSTAGTLGNLKRFYFSVSLAEFNAKTPDGHPLKSYLSFLTSHDGTLCPTVRDSHIRPVCANTVGFILAEMENFQITGKHTENGLASLDNLGNLLEIFQRGNAKLETEIFPKLAETRVDLSAMREITAGYFFQSMLQSGTKIPDRVTMTTQAWNATEEITQLARTGNGNGGENLYDLWNGGTDYWSNGNGAGSLKVGLSKRASRSMFGQAAEHKSEFSRYLFDSEKVTQGREIGAKALQNYAMAKA